LLDGKKGREIVRRGAKERGTSRRHLGKRRKAGKDLLFGRARGSEQVREGKGEKSGKGIIPEYARQATYGKIPLLAEKKKRRIII